MKLKINVLLTLKILEVEFNMIINPIINAHWLKRMAFVKMA